MKMIQSESKEKKVHLERLLSLGTIMVFLDSRIPEVKVPSVHKGLSQLALNFSYNFANSDFKVTDTHLESTLTFPDGKFFCFIPLSALYGITSRFAGETVVFPSDMPPEIIKKMVEPEITTGPTLIAPTPIVSTPAPAVLTPITTLPTSDEKPEPSPRKKGHLKLVKS